jgi:hypothetical protein
MAGQRRQDEAGAEALDERRQGTATADITFVALGCACGCAAYDAGWRPPEVPDHSAGTIEDWTHQMRPLREAAQALSSLRRTIDPTGGITAILEEMRLPWTAEGRARLAERERERAQQRQRAAAAAAAASAVHGWQGLGHAVEAWAKRTLARRPPAGPVIDPATDPVDPALILEAEEQAAELETRFALVAATFTPRQQIAWDLRDQSLGILAARLRISTPAAKQLRRRTWNKVLRRSVT